MKFDDWIKEDIINSTAGMVSPLVSLMLLACSCAA